MKKEGLILIMEPERIIGLELQVLLESNGYSVSQFNAVKLVDEFKDKQKVRVIIINIDKTKADGFLYIKKHFSLAEVCVIGLSSSKQLIKEREGIKFIATFSKPFESKSILSFVDKCCAVNEFK
jgi:DNA-binding NtrC family response regulator